jgi:predicted  nucleic acid-binding Zn-ribbon protein
MAGVVQNLVYRVSVSAIVGAIVAGGLIYLNNDRVVKSYRAEQATQTEQQDMTNKALMEANDNMASAISVMEAEQAQQLADFSDALSALEAKIDAIPVAEAADYSEITEAIAALNADLTAKIEAIVPAAPEQN